MGRVKQKIGANNRVDYFTEIEVEVAWCWPSRTLTKETHHVSAEKTLGMDRPIREYREWSSCRFWASRGKTVGCLWRSQRECRPHVGGNRKRYVQEVRP